MAEPDATNRRKITNVFIDPRLQLLLFLPYVVTLVGFVLTNLFIVRFVIAAFGQLNVDPAGAGAPNLIDIYHRLMLYSGVGLVTASVIGFLLVIAINHRLLGPLYNIQRHVGRMKAGEYHHRITLRKGDRLVELAHDLNAVTERLNGSVGTISPKT